MTAAPGHSAKPRLRGPHPALPRRPSPARGGPERGSSHADELADAFDRKEPLSGPSRAGHSRAGMPVTLDALEASWDEDLRTDDTMLRGTSRAPAWDYH